MKYLLWAIPLTALVLGPVQAAQRPNIILVMADDMGWGHTGYRNHPILRTPNLDAMAANGLRFERFYAGGPVCSPTRVSVLTGRSPDRAGVLTHGYALRQQETTIAQALRQAGYVTGHFGKWHLNGFKGPGAPILQDDPQELRDLSSEQRGIFSRLKRDLLAWNEAVDASFARHDYPEGKLVPPDPKSIFWYDAPQYAPYLPQWKDRWEFHSYLNQRRPATE